MKAAALNQFALGLLQMHALARLGAAECALMKKPEPVLLPAAAASVQNSWAHRCLQEEEVEARASSE